MLSVWHSARILTAAYFVVVSRALTRPFGELSTFPAALYTRRIGRATLSMVVGGAVVAVAVVLGLIFFVLPGLFFAACFLFFIFAVGVEDRGVVGGLKRSWGLSQGNRLRLVALVFFAGLVGSVVGAVPAIFQAAGEPVVGQLVAVVINSLLFVVIYGVMAAAYLQAGGSRRGPGSAGGTASTSGALDSSW